jgi:molybdate transport system substrate-binding protein
VRSTRSASALILVVATLISLIFAAFASGRAIAADISMLSGGAAKSGLTDAVPGYEKSSGDKVVFEFSPMGPLGKKLESGAAPDVVVITTDVLPRIRDKGFIVVGTETEVGRVEIGIAVRTGAPRPDISTPEAFKALLLKSKSIAMINPATGTSGKHLALVFQKLGIYDALKSKLVLTDSGYAVAPVGRGEAEVGIHQITEILPVPGVTLVGPLPASLQKVTTYVGAVGAKAKNADAARRLLAYLRTPAARAAFAKRGYVAEN